MLNYPYKSVCKSRYYLPVFEVNQIHISVPVYVWIFLFLYLKAVNPNSLISTKHRYEPVGDSVKASTDFLDSIPIALSASFFTVSKSMTSVFEPAIEHIYTFPFGRRTCTMKITNHSIATSEISFYSVIYFGRSHFKLFLTASTFIISRNGAANKVKT